MIEVQPQSHGNLLVIKASSKLTHDDYENILIPKLSSIIKDHNKAKVLFDFGEHFPGMELEAAWDDTKFGVTHRNDFEKAAVVGGDDWVKWGSKLGALITSCPIRTYNPDGFDKALTWLEREEVDGMQYREIPDTNVMEVDIDGRVSAENYHEVAEAALAFMEKHDKVRVIKIIRNYDGVDLEILKEKLILKMFAHRGDITHAAVVTDKRWITSLSKFVTPLYKCKTRIYQMAEVDDARKWITEVDN